MQKIPFYRTSLDKQGIDFIAKSLTKNGKELVDEFEGNINKFFNSKYAISTNSGTSAIHLALCAMKLKRADKFICSVNSFPNIAQSIRHFDAEPIFVDINDDDFNISIDSFEAVLKEHKHKKLKGAFITHIAGQAANMKEIYEIAKKYDLKIIDDASTAIGVSYDDKKIGSIKDSFISCFQAAPQAISDSMAMAGFFVTDDEEISQRARLIRNHALVYEQNSKDEELNYIYDITDIGQQYSISGVCASYAALVFEKTSNMIKRRKEIAAIYDKELGDCPHIQIPVAKKEHIYTQYIIKVDKNRDDFAKELFERGVETSLHYIPVYLLSYYKQKYNFKINDFPNALRVYGQILSLPIYASLSDDEVYYICEQIKNVVASRAY